MTDPTIDINIIQNIYNKDIEGFNNFIVEKIIGFDDLENFKYLYENQILDYNCQDQFGDIRGVMEYSLFCKSKEIVKFLIQNKYNENITLRTILFNFDDFEAIKEIIDYFEYKERILDAILNGRLSFETFKFIVEKFDINNDDLKESTRYIYQTYKLFDDDDVRLPIYYVYKKEKQILEEKVEYLIVKFPEYHLNLLDKKEIPEPLKKGIIKKLLKNY